MRVLSACLVAAVLLSAGCDDDGGGLPAAPSILTQPLDVTATEGDWATFTVEADGSGREYRWEGSPDGGTTWYAMPYGDSAVHFLIGVALGDDGLLFRCVVSNAGGEVTSDAALLTVEPTGTGTVPPAITTHPAEVVAGEGAWVTFTVEATGDGLEYEWQHSYDGGTTWFPVAWGAWESYTLDGVSLGVDGVLFRCVVSNAGGEVASDAAELHVLHTIFVDANATGACNGATWGNAFTDLQDALVVAQSDWEIWVAAGTYVPTDTTDRTATFQLVAGIPLYGGFAGHEVSRDERDYSVNVSILSGNIGDADEAWDNSYHVVTGADNALLDGFSIMDGFATGIASGDGGGGMYNCEASPVVANCTFSGNSAAGNAGGGMYNYDASPVVADCTFSGNSASHGGGMFNDESSSPAVTDCVFSGNSASIDGGGIYNYLNTSPIVANCTFTGNSASYNGGGMKNNMSSSSATVTDCTFSGNTAVDGGGMSNSGSSLTVTNCTFSGNTASNNGGGMSNSSDGDPTVTNCTFDGNSADSDGGGMSNSGSTPIATNCTFTGNSAIDGGGMCNSGGSPNVTNCTFSGNEATSFGGGVYSTSSSSLAVTNSILWGNTASTAGAEIYNNSSTPVVGYTCIEGGINGTGCAGDTSTDDGGNIGDSSGDDPLFVRAPDPGPDGNWDGVDDDYGDLRPSSGSPCIDTGSNAPFQVGGPAYSVTKDLDGRTRIYDGDGLDTDSSGDGDNAEVDMGAYEFY